MNASTAQRTVLPHLLDTSSSASTPPPPKKPRPVTAWQLLLQQREQQQNSTQTHSFSLIPHSREPWLQLDAPGIYELVGAAGTGKTQLALQWALTVVQEPNDNHISSPDVVKEALPAKQRNIYYLSCSSLTPKLERLQQIITEQQRSSNNNNNNNKNALHRIWTRRIVHLDDFWDVLHELSHRPNVHAVVLDSLADLFRGEMDWTKTTTTTTTTGVSITERSNQFFRIAQHLLQWNIPCLILNQLQLEDRPALGISWAHCITRRYRIVSTTTTTSNGGGSHRIRTLILEHAPDFGPQRTCFVIQRQGICSCITER